jgi:hypothetical protein
MMALAIRLDRLIEYGQITDQAELTREGYVSRARLTQIMNLLQLAPDIQEQILFVPPGLRGSEMITERELRSIDEQMDWHEQRQSWKRFRD